MFTRMTEPQQTIEASIRAAFSQQRLGQPPNRAHRPRWIAVYVERQPEIGPIVAAQEDENVAGDAPERRHTPGVFAVMLNDHRPHDPISVSIITGREDLVG